MEMIHDGANAVIRGLRRVDGDDAALLTTLPLPNAGGEAPEPGLVSTRLVTQWAMDLELLI